MLPELIELCWTELSFSICLKRVGHLDLGYEVEHDDGNLQQHVAHPSFPAGEHFSYEVTRSDEQATLLAICPGNLTYE